MKSEVSNTVRLARPDHCVSRSLIDSDALWILRKLRKAGYQAFLVGGAVRDILLGGEPKDFDIGTDARPSQIKKVFRNSRLIGRRFRIAHIYFRHKGRADKIMEVTTFRGTGDQNDHDDLHPEDRDLTGSSFGTVEEDAWRRDFTVNSLFYDIADFSVIDYTGGLADLDKGIIRLIGAPDERFEEDPVRMLRALEFAVRLGFEIEEETRDGIVRNAALISDASSARLREEFRQMEQRGITGAVLSAAQRLGLFEYLFPELDSDERLGALVETFDAQARKGAKVQEHLFIAAFCLPTAAALCPLGPDTGLEAASEIVYPLVRSVCMRYQISAHIRHEARELLLGVYRVAKGKSYRAKGKFARKSEFVPALSMLKAWSAASEGELDGAVAFWEQFLEERQQSGGVQTDKPAGRRRRPRRRNRRPRRSTPVDGGGQ
jgi:poly(A) polymerase